MLAKISAVDSSAMRVTSGRADSSGNPYYFTLSATTIIAVYVYDITGESCFTPVNRQNISENDFMFICCEVGRPYDAVILKRGVK